MILVPIIDPKIFFGTIAGCIFVGVLIKLYEILTYEKRQTESFAFVSD